MRTPQIAFCALALLPAAAWSEEYDCLIEARQMIEIRSPVEGLIESITVDRGDSVKKGQVLVVLESGPERAALEIARSKARMKGPVDAARARVEYAKTKERRQEELYQQNFVSSSALDEARTERRLAESELRVALENQNLAELEVTRTEELLGMRSIRSPFNGVVVDRLMDPGEFATTNLREPILKLAETDPLNVEVVLPATQFGKVRKGDRGEVSAETGGGRLDARVVVVDRVIDGASGTFGVRLELRNPNGSVPAGAKCRVRLGK